MSSKTRELYLTLIRVHKVSLGLLGGGTCVSVGRQKVGSVTGGEGNVSG